MTYRAVDRKLRRLGCQELPRRGGGSHRKGQNLATGGLSVLPDWGSKDLRLGTVRAAVRELGIEWEHSREHDRHPQPVACCSRVTEDAPRRTDRGARSGRRLQQQDQALLAAVLWPDKEQQWTALLPRLRGRLPLFTLEPYAPDLASGPAYWLRCVIAGTIPHTAVKTGQVPILYLPGVSRQEVRAVESCPRALQPLAELQCRGVLWTQKNGRDWTIAAFLQSHDGGATWSEHPLPAMATKVICIACAAA